MVGMALKASESLFAVPLLDAVRARGFRAEVAVMGMGYDHEAVYAGCEVERENGRLEHEWALLPLRVRRIARVGLHADLTILARLACALATARAVPLAA